MRAPRKDGTEPLGEADLDSARQLHAQNPEAFSTPAVARLLGRSRVYAQRVRDVVRAEAGLTAPTNPTPKETGPHG